MTEAGAEPSYLDTAVEAVRRAGVIQLEGLGRPIDIRKKGTIDLVTEIDLAVERMIRALIAERHPDHDVLAEEFGGPGIARSRCCWIVDPLDGTTNYAHGLPLFCCTVALEVDGVLEVGAIYDPTRDELFTAERGMIAAGVTISMIPVIILYLLLQRRFIEGITAGALKS